MAAKAKADVSSKAKASVSKIVKKRKTTSNISGKLQAKAKVKAKVKPRAKSASKKKASSEIKVKKEEVDALLHGEVDLDHKKANTSGSSTEARGAIFRKAPSQRVKEKMERALEQRFVLIDRERESGPKEIFKVLGSTGNVYTVLVDLKPSCDCPDARKNIDQVCKHVIFVFLKVLKIPVSDHTWYQKALLKSELQEIFAKAKPDPTLLNAQMQSAYLIATGRHPTPAAAAAAASLAETISSSSGRRNIPQAGNDTSCCPICYDDFTPGQTKGLIFCETSCGNPVHELCQEQWMSNCQTSKVTCVWCRTVMPQTKETQAAPSQVVEALGVNYLNLAGSSGQIDPVRDFSVYSRSCESGLSLNMNERKGVTCTDTTKSLALIGMYTAGTISRSELAYWTSM